VWCGCFDRLVAFPLPFLSWGLDIKGLSEGSCLGSDPGSGVGGFFGASLPCCCVNIDNDCS
jgi:hypothetical protein